MAGVVVVSGSNPRLLYKHVFPPAYRGEVAFFGFARPAFGSLPPTAEMQVRSPPCPACLPACAPIGPRHQFRLPCTD